MTTRYKSRHFNAYRIGEMIKEDFPNIGNGLKNGKTMNELTQIFMCNVRYGFLEIYDEEKLKDYSREKQVIQQAIRFACYGYYGFKYKYELEDYDGLLTEEEVSEIKQIQNRRKKEKQIGFYKLTSEELGLASKLSNPHSNRNNALDEKKRQQFFILWGDQRYQRKNGKPDFIKISSEMGIPPENLRTFFSRYNRKNGVDAKKHIDWNRKISNTHTLLEHLIDLAHQPEYQTSRYGKIVPRYKELAEIVKINIHEYQHIITPDKIRKAFKRNHVTLEDRIAA